MLTAIDSHKEQLESKDATLSPAICYSSSACCAERYANSLFATSPNGMRQLQFARTPSAGDTKFQTFEACRVPTNKNSCSNLPTLA